MSNTIASVPRRPPMKPRMIRTSDEDWEAALAQADARGEILSEEIRAFVKHYARGETYEIESKP